MNPEWSTQFLPSPEQVIYISDEEESEEQYDEGEGVNVGEFLKDSWGRQERLDDLVVYKALKRMLPETVLVVDSAALAVAMRRSTSKEQRKALGYITCARFQAVCIPVHSRGHWSLLFYSRHTKKGKTYHYDTIRYANWRHAEKVFLFLRGIGVLPAHTIYKEIAPCGWLDPMDFGCFTQESIFECGYYVLLNVYAIVTQNQSERVFPVDLQRISDNKTWKHEKLHFMFDFLSNTK